MRLDDYFYFIHRNNLLKVPTLETTWVEILKQIVECKIYPVFIPRIHAGETDLYPCVTYQRTGGGRQDKSNPQIKPRFLLTVYGKVLQDVWNIAETLSSKLDGRLSAEIWGCRLVNRIESVEEAEAGSDVWLNVTLLEFELLAVETTRNPKYSYDGSSGNILEGIHTYLTEQDVNHYSLNAPSEELNARMPYFTINPRMVFTEANAARRIGSLTSQLEFNFYGDDYDVLKTFHETIRLLFTGLHGSVGGTTINTAYNVDEEDGYAPPVHGENNPTYRIISTWKFSHRGT